MNEIETFRQQLIKQNPEEKTQQELIKDDIERAYEALDSLTDRLADLIDETDCKECLKFYAQMRGEMCAAYNSVLFAKQIIEEEGDDCSQD